MAQTIKFVYENGKIRIQHTQIDLTKTICKDLQHDYAERLPGGDMNRVKYFALTEGEFAKEEKRKHYHNAKATKKLRS